MSKGRMERLFLGGLAGFAIDAFIISPSFYLLWFFQPSDVVRYWNERLAIVVPVMLLIAVAPIAIGIFVQFWRTQPPPPNHRSQSI